MPKKKEKIKKMKFVGEVEKPTKKFPNGITTVIINGEKFKLRGDFRKEIDRI